MLNELFVAARGLPAEEVQSATRHRNIKTCRSIPTLLVSLGGSGRVTRVQPVHAGELWTLRDGQHNSFPFVQPKPALWKLSAADLQAVPRGRLGLLDLAKSAHLNSPGLRVWLAPTLPARLSERRSALDALIGSEAEIFLATIDRFILGISGNNSIETLFAAVVAHLLEGLLGSEQWEPVARALLVGKVNKKKGTLECAGALMFEAGGFDRSIVDLAVPSAISALLIELEGSGGKTDANRGVCAISGAATQLLQGEFPQPNLPILGQTFVFAKNKATPASARYGRSGSDGMRVGVSTAEEISAALVALTRDEREGLTWCGIPGEVPGQQDLLIGFVEGVPDVDVVGQVAGDVGDDLSEEKRSDGIAEDVDAVAGYEKRTQRLIDAVRGVVTHDFRRTPVRMTVLRKLDPANRKVVYAGSVDVGELYDSAVDWAAGERNVPPWFSVPVFRKGKAPIVLGSRHVAPLELVRFTRKSFVCRGTKCEEICGVSAATAMQLFFDCKTASMQRLRLRRAGILRDVLRARSGLIMAVGEEWHQSGMARTGAGHNKKNFDSTREAFDTAVVLGLLLYKQGRKKEDYVRDAGFKLGQLLAIADVVHAGYCADVRGGRLPPSLLGNQILPTAQTAPGKALNMLLRRWKPYSGWVMKTRREYARIEQLASNSNRDLKERGWAVKVALRQARELAGIASELESALQNCKIDEVFRAELFLGYVAGLPKAPARSDGTKDAEFNEECE